jgi:hypothetical protein
VGGEGGNSLSDPAIGNPAAFDGGAVDAEGSADTTLQATLCTFTSNWVSGNGDGGALFTTDTTAVNAKKQPIPTITLSSFSNNTAAHGHGGALAYEPLTNSASSLLVSYNTFTNNSALAGGGVFSNVNTNSGAVTEKILGCLFNGNQATPGDQDAGGGLYAAQQTSGTGSNTLNVYNSTFFQNAAVGNGNDGSGDGGGIYLYIDASGTGTNTTKLTSLTVYKNNADFDGGGLYVDPNSNFGVANSVPQQGNRTKIVKLRPVA